MSEKLLTREAVITAVNALFGEGPDVQSVSRHAFLRAVDHAEALDYNTGWYGIDQDNRKALAETLGEDWTSGRSVEEGIRVLGGWKDDARRHAQNEGYYRGLLDDVAGALCDARVYHSDDGSAQDEPIRLKLPGLVRELVLEHRELRGFRDGIKAAIRLEEAVGQHRLVAHEEDADVMLTHVAHDLGAKDGENVLDVAERVVRALRTIEKLVARGGSLDDLDVIRQEVLRLDLPEDG